MGHGFHGYATNDQNVSFGLISDCVLKHWCTAQGIRAQVFSARWKPAIPLRRPWPKARDRHGYGSIPIDTIFSGMNIHLPAILMFTRGTRVLTHPQISRYRVYQPGVSHHYGGMTHDPTKTSEIIIPKLAPLESTSKIIIPKHWTPLESREFERLPLGGDWRHVPASRKAGG